MSAGDDHTNYQEPTYTEGSDEAELYSSVTECFRNFFKIQNQPKYIKARHIELLKIFHQLIKDVANKHIPDSGKRNSY